MTNEAVYEVSTQWGSIRLDEQSYQDYLDGRSWLSSAFDVMGTAKLWKLALGTSQGKR